jgi:hypothetical protein
VNAAFLIQSKLKSLQKPQMLKVVLTAVLRERNAESAEDAAITADSERLLAVSD